MKGLHELPNISKVIEEKLTEAGIDSPEQLIEIGSRKAFMKIRQYDDTACINMLYALEGALQGIRWHNLSDESKNELREFYKSL